MHTYSSHHLFFCVSYPSRTAKEVFSYTTTDERSNISIVLRLKHLKNVLDAIDYWGEPPSVYSCPYIG